jgi:WD40 repeat protein
VTAEQNTARLRDASTCAPRGKPLVHAGGILAVALRRDGKLALTGSADGTARLWDAVTGRLSQEPLNHPAAVTAVAFGPEDGTLLTVCKDGSVRLWDAVTARQLGPPLAHGGEVRCWAFAPDGRSLLTGSADRTARQWHVAAPLHGSVEHVVLWVQVLTRLQLDDQVPRELDDETWRERRRQLEGLGGTP